MATLTEWDFFNRNVQSGMVEGRYINAAFTLLAAGPPRLAAAGNTSSQAPLTSDIAYPIGIIQNFNLGQNAQVMRLFEIGSERSYFIRGRTVGNLGLGRIMYHGPSLLRVLYAYQKSTETDGVQYESLYDNTANAKLNTSGKSDAKGTYHTAAGSNNIWLNLASDIFSQPIGLMLLMRDSNNDTVGAFYFEYCHVVNHGFATDSGGTVISENAAITYDRMVPIDLQTVNLIKDSTSLGSVIDGDAIGSAE